MNDRFLWQKGDSRIQLIASHLQSDSGYNLAVMNNEEDRIIQIWEISDEEADAVTDEEYEAFTFPDNKPVDVPDWTEEDDRILTEASRKVHDNQTPEQRLEQDRAMEPYLEYLKDPAVIAQWEVWTRRARMRDMLWHKKNAGKPGFSD